MQIHIHARERHLYQAEHLTVPPQFIVNLSKPATNLGIPKSKFQLIYLKFDLKTTIFRLSCYFF